MQYTTPTEIVKKGSKVFDEYSQAVVLKNNKPIWVLFGGALAQALVENDIITQVREELWELQDTETSSMITDYKNNGLSEDSVSFDEFRKNYEV